MPDHTLIAGEPDNAPGGDAFYSPPDPLPAGYPVISWALHFGTINHDTEALAGWLSSLPG